MICFFGGDDDDEEEEGVLGDNSLYFTCNAGMMGDDDESSTHFVLPFFFSFPIRTFFFASLDAHRNANNELVAVMMYLDDDFPRKTRVTHKLRTQHMVGSIWPSTRHVENAVMYDSLDSMDPTEIFNS